jgi:hypothetical protein
MEYVRANLTVSYSWGLGCRGGEGQAAESECRLFADVRPGAGRKKTGDGRGDGVEFEVAEDALHRHGAWGAARLAVEAVEPSVDAEDANGKRQLDEGLPVERRGEGVGGPGAAKAFDALSKALHEEWRGDDVGELVSLFQGEWGCEMEAEAAAELRGLSVGK